VVKTPMRAGRPIRRGTVGRHAHHEQEQQRERIAGRNSGSVTRVKTWP
jgi:hypothetical protein